MFIFHSARPTVGARLARTFDGAQFTGQKFAFLLTSSTAFEIHYFHDRVYAEVQSRPVDVPADYFRLVELLAGHGPSLRLAHSRAFGDGLFELRPRGRTGIGRAFYCFFAGKKSGRSACIH